MSIKCAFVGSLYKIKKKFCIYIMLSEVLISLSAEDRLTSQEVLLLHGVGWLVQFPHPLLLLLLLSLLLLMYVIYKCRGLHKTIWKSAGWIPLVLKDGPFTTWLTQRATLWSERSELCFCYDQ